MIVFIPTIEGKLRPGVREAVEAQGVDAVAWTLYDHEFEYGRVLARFWTECASAGADLAVIEHDVIVPDGCFEAFEECDEPWCAHSYPVFWGGIAETYGGAWGLGCVRFRWQLMAGEPDALACALRWRGVPGRAPGHWQQLDGAVSATLRARGYDAHRHMPDAVHLHEYNRTRAEQEATWVSV